MIAHAARSATRRTLWTDRTGRRPTHRCRPASTRPSQADAVCRAVLEHRERGRGAAATRPCCSAPRTTRDLLEVELARRNIPFVKYGGLKFLEAAHVKDALAMLRVLENPWDEVAWFRVLQLPDGVGPATARRLMDELGVRDRAGRRLADGQLA